MVVTSREEEEGRQGKEAYMFEGPRRPALSKEAREVKAKEEREVAARRDPTLQNFAPNDRSITEVRHERPAQAQRVSKASPRTKREGEGRPSE
jgi:hypothetical protein